MHDFALRMMNRSLGKLQMASHILFILRTPFWLQRTPAIDPLTLLFINRLVDTFLIPWLVIDAWDGSVESWGLISTAFGTPN